MNRLGYKNEKIFIMSIDFLVIALLAALLYFTTGFPHFFNYFYELENAQSIIDPSQYSKAMINLINRFDMLIFEVSSLYFIYESLGLIIFKTTLGRKVFNLKVELNFLSKYDLIFRILIIPARTLVKIISITTVIPMFIIGAIFLFGRKNRTLIDILFLTETVDREE
jgi:hypothetical protein